MPNDPRDPPQPPGTTYPPPGTADGGWQSGGWQPGQGQQGGGALVGQVPTGYKTASLILLCLGGAMFVLGLFPCMGWMNWFGVPINGAAALVGILGLASGPKLPSGVRPFQGYYIAALLVGLLGFIGGSLRCIAGAGMF